MYGMSVAGLCAPAGDSRTRVIRRREEWTYDMDWLSRLPVIGPWVTRFMRTHAWRSYETLDEAHWTRLAAAITFISFLALFPLITVAAAIGATLLTDDQLDKIEKKVADQVPGISDQLDIGALVANAGTVGLVAGALLLVTGISWVGSMRECLRAVWGSTPSRATRSC